MNQLQYPIKLVSPKLLAKKNRLSKHQNIQNQQKIRKVYSTNKAKSSEKDIIEYQRELKLYNLTFSELVYSCPKHRYEREHAKEVAKMITETPHIVSQLKRKKKLPLTLLLKQHNVDTAIVSKHKKYIVAITLLLLGKYKSLQSYIQ